MSYSVVTLSLQVSTVIKINFMSSTTQYLTTRGCAGWPVLGQLPNTLAATLARWREIWSLQVHSLAFNYWHKLNILAKMVFSSHDCYTYYNNLFWRGLMWRKAREGKLKILFFDLFPARIIFGFKIMPVKSILWIINSSKHFCLWI